MAVAARELGMTLHLVAKLRDRRLDPVGAALPTAHLMSACFGALRAVLFYRGTCHAHSLRRR